MALDQNLALEGVALRRVAAGLKQIGIAAEDFAIPEHDHAAALAYSSILQADMDRIQTVFHEVAGCDVRETRSSQFRSKTFIHTRINPKPWFSGYPLARISRKVGPRNAW
jgi:hypothetical protein